MIKLFFFLILEISTESEHLDLKESLRVLIFKYSIDFV